MGRVGNRYVWQGGQTENQGGQTKNFLSALRAKFCPPWPETLLAPLPLATKYSQICANLIKLIHNKSKQKLYWNKRETYGHNILWGYNISLTLQKSNNNIEQKPKSAESGPQIRLEHPLSGQTVTPFTLARY